MSVMKINICSLKNYFKHLAAKIDLFCRWNAYLEKKRREFYWLNYFTSNQITFLCEQLACVGPSQLLQVQAYTLLSTINPGVSHNKVVKCMNQVTSMEEQEEKKEQSIQSRCFYKREQFIPVFSSHVNEF